MHAATSSNESNSPHGPVKAATVLLQIMSGMLCASVVLTLLGIAVVDMFIVPKYAQSFADFDAQMPGLTTMVLQMPRILVLLITLLLVILLIAKEFVIPSIAAKLAINMLAFLLAASVVLVLLIAMYLPMVALMESVM